MLEASSSPLHRGRWSGPERPSVVTGNPVLAPGQDTSHGVCLILHFVLQPPLFDLHIFKQLKRPSKFHPQLAFPAQCRCGSFFLSTQNLADELQDLDRLADTAVIRICETRSVERIQHHAQLIELQLGGRRVHGADQLVQETQTAHYSSTVTTPIFLAHDQRHRQQVLTLGDWAGAVRNTAAHKLRFSDDVLGGDTINIPATLPVLLRGADIVEHSNHCLRLDSERPSEAAKLDTIQFARFVLVCTTHCTIHGSVLFAATNVETLQATFHQRCLSLPVLQSHIPFLCIRGDVVWGVFWYPALECCLHTPMNNLEASHF
mmetsp:Transcript_41854/g.100558  ORF Transcript_41854/g.100558 Transcript_41854/m.100558 type:complete len:318 (+) Transcript_41854:269-1222(+)